MTVLDTLVEIMLPWGLNQHLQIASVLKLAVATVLTVAIVLHLRDSDLTILLNHADNCIILFHFCSIP